jgi:hypothetical protein
MKKLFICLTMLLLVFSACKKNICVCPKTKVVENNTAYAYDIYIVTPFNVYFPQGRIAPFQFREISVPCFNGNPSNLIVAIPVDTTDRQYITSSPCDDKVTLEK